MSQTFAPSIAVCSPRGEVLFHAHAEHAKRLVRDGAASVTSIGKRVREITLKEGEGEDRCKPRAGNPLKYTYREPLGDPVDAHCHSHKPHIANPRNWHIFRAALVDCLPACKQDEIRKLFATERRRAA